jgi:hypothetical protein
MKKWAAYLLLSTLAFFYLASGSFGQTVQGVITGTITDPSGASVPGATVTITNIGTNLSQSTTTGSDGSYRFPLVPPGTYTLDVKAASFAEVKASGLVVQASQTVPFDIKLELAKTTTLVEVNAQLPLVQTATADLGFQVDSSTIDHAALVDRDVFGTLPFLAPQVSPGLDGSPTSGGARESGTSYMLNGSDDNNNFSEGAINNSPPLESIEDFNIITNSMSAQYGRGAGAVVSANQKSGTNKFHGSLYEQNRNATLNSNDFFYNRDYGNSLGSANPLPKRPKYIKNQFGGSVGGPIIKNKTFFYVTVDRLKLSQGATSANNFVPTNAALAALKATPGLGSLAQAALTAYPPATSDNPCPDDPINTGGTNTVGCLSFSDPVTTTQNVFYARADHNFSSKDRLSFAANISRATVNDKFGGGGIPSSGSIPAVTTLNTHNLSLIETHTFSPRLFNEVNVSHNRFFNPFVEGNPAQQSAPEIIIDNQSAGNRAFTFGPFEGGQIQSFVQDRWSLQDNLTWTFGRHALKFGVTANSGVLYRNWDLGLPGQYEFGDFIKFSDGTSGPCPVGALVTPACDGTLQPDGTIANVLDETNANFAGDYPYFQETSIDPRTGAQADAYRHYTYHDYATFVQDDWKVTSHLTLNLGLRWERFGAPAEDHNILAQFTNLGSQAGCSILNAACLSAARVNPVSRMWNTRNHDFGPRIGFAWDPTGRGKMAVRGSYGIYYDRIFDNIWSNGAWNPPFYALLDFEADLGDAIFYSNPASIGAAYDPNGPNGPIPYPGKRVSVRTMDINMKDSSGQNFYLGVERQMFGGLLFRASYQGQFGRHLPMLENYNRVDGIGYYTNMVQLAQDSSATPIPNLALSPVRPNALYTGFNYRSNSVSSNWNALVLEAQKHMGHGLEFQAGYTFSKLLDVNSELFAGCSTVGGFTAPYYYISNAEQKLSYGKGAYDHKNAFKFNFTYELPFMKSEKGFVGHALGGWSLGSFFQFYSGHPVDVVDGRTRFRARDINNALVVDANGVPFNLGGDYNLDGVANDHPVFVGSSLSNVYSGASPADGIFKDNNIIGCGAPWVTANGAIANVDACNARFGVGTPNSLFVSPDYPSSGAPYLRFGTLGRNVFHGPQFVSMDLGLKKTFRLTESMNLRFSADAQNLFNHPNFDCIQGNLGSSTFGQAQCLAGGASAAKSRVMSLSLRLAF